MKRRVILIVLDGVGIGSAPDAAAFGNAGANTLLHVAEQAGPLHLPNLQQLGLGNILPLPGVAAVSKPTGAFGRMIELSCGKDTTAGHWELAGVVLREPFTTFPTGFPDEIIAAFCNATGLDPLGNIAASGTEILKELGEEHLHSGRPIIYTSADSVLQIAAHEQIIPVEKLYAICQIALEILIPYRVPRVIARPFVGTNAHNFRRTSRRHDFSLPAPTATILDRLQQSGLPVHGIGKVSDIFAGRGISHSTTTRDNQEGIDQTIAALKKIDRGLIFTNLVDFDMLYGHRRDCAGFARALCAFDQQLPALMAQMSAQDLLLITADHGCDPTFSGTDHTRENVPLLVWQHHLKTGIELGIRHSFTDVAATIGDFFAAGNSEGSSFLSALRT
ncbi:MAG: phosphopentomutase [Desulfuromonadales bacterium]|nr:phosphopentomutase [Desulfuromonadales bacterium]MDT8423300.1 phosphopentomutase [Desulfuromonadales bacterium]